MKVVCDICGKEQELVDSIEDIEGSYKEKRWMYLRSVTGCSEKIICGGGFFDADGEHDKCLAEEVKNVGGMDKFYLYKTIEVFFPLKSIVPELAKFFAAQDV